MVQDIAISIGSIVFVFVGLLTINKGRRERAESGRIEETETTAIGDLTPGPTEIKGTVHPTNDATIQQSPFSNTESIATHIEIKEWHTGGQGAGNWRAIYEEKSAEPMVVEDGTGEVEVELPPEGGLNLETTETTIESDDEPPPEIRQYVENHTDVDIPERHSVGALSVGERRRYVEGVLEPGEDVYLLGKVRKPDAGWDEQEYVLDTPTAEGDFILSNKSEEELIREGERGGLVFLVFGGILTIVGVGSLVYPLLPV